MSQPGRRRRGTATDAVGFYVEVDPALKAFLDRASKATNRPKWFVFEEMLRRLGTELGPDDRPEWWPDDAAHQGELPLKTA